MTSSTKFCLTLNQILDRDQNSFSVVRLAMAFAVLVSHSYFFVSGSALTEPLVSITGHSLGEHGVQVFFILSGLLIAQSIAKSASLSDFALARALRIFPGLVVCVLLTAFVLGPMVTSLSQQAYFSGPLLPTYLLKTLFLTTGAAPLPGVFAPLPASGLVNMSLWTLKYEVACYVGVGLLGIAGAFASRYTMITGGALAVLMIALALMLPESTSDLTALENLCYFSLYFTVGMLAFVMRHNLVLSTRPLAVLVVAAIGTHGTALAELTFVLALAYGTLCVAAIDFGWLRRLTERNDLSFGVYIYAAPIQQTIVQMNPEITPLTLAAAATVFTLAAAYLSWEWIEKPALALRHSKPSIWQIKSPTAPNNGWQTGLNRLKARAPCC
jgi:peptidoglycan/LPS O-acetylase OafA/YrhL